MDYTNERPLKSELYSRLGEEVNELNILHQALHKYVFDLTTFNQTGLTAFEIGQRIKFLSEDIKFTTYFLLKNIEEDKNSEKRIK